MDMIQRDPALLHAYQMYELTLFDEASRLYGAKQEGKQKERNRFMELLNKNYTLEQLKEILAQESRQTTTTTQ
jgi:hypothetical protein